MIPVDFFYLIANHFCFSSEREFSYQKPSDFNYKQIENVTYGLVMMRLLKIIEHDTSFIQIFIDFNGVLMVFNLEGNSCN